MPYIAIRHDMPACRDGIAATGLPTPCRIRSIRSRPISDQPLLVIRDTGPISSICDAIHGGAIG